MRWQLAPISHPNSTRPAHFRYNAYDVRPRAANGDDNRSDSGWGRGCVAECRVTEPNWEDDQDPGQSGTSLRGGSWSKGDERLGYPHAGYLCPMYVCK